MTAIAAAFLMILSLLCAGLLTMLGVSYIEEGFGLHPALAGAGVFVAGAVGAWAMGWLEDLCEGA